MVVRTYSVATEHLSGHSIRVIIRSYLTSNLQFYFGGPAGGNIGLPYHLMDITMWMTIHDPFRRP